MSEPAPKPDHIRRDFRPRILRSGRIRAAAIITSFLCTPPAFADHPDYEANRGIIAVGGFIVYYNSQGPLSWLSMTRREIPPSATLLGEVQGRSCQYALSVPTQLSFRATSVSGAQGNGSIFKAMNKIKEAHPDLTGLYDVKIDMHRIAFLGVFQRQCTEIVARGFKY